MNKSYVENWDLVKLKPYDLQDVADHMADHILDDKKWKEAVEGEGCSDLIRPGDNFVVPTTEGNVKEVEFYVLQCTRGKYEVHDEFKCAWGLEFEASYFIIQGTYYQKWNNSYVFLATPNRPILMHILWYMISFL